ncbi:MAG: carbohydrate ABC transporter permease [Candidatus Caccosoma sp.]|nr:carbohydrate ABC transporter permease [Candidatus Caccosoma sp.]
MKIKSKEDVVVDIVSIVLTAIFALICLYPIVYCLSMSFSGDDAVIKGSVWLFPKGINFESYALLFSDKMFWRSLFNSVFYTVLGTFLSLIGNLSLGYVLSRPKFIFKKVLNIYILIPMLFSGGLIPTFLVIKALGLYNTIWALVLPGAVGTWNCILVRTFFKTTIPEGIIEASYMDGANHFQILRYVVLPLSKTIIAIIGLFTAVGIWNDYFNALIYLTNKNLYPLQLYLKDILSAQTNMANISGILNSSDYVKNLVNSQRIKYVLIIVSTLPIAIVYPFVQKYFVKGVMIGSIKE